MINTIDYIHWDTSDMQNLSCGAYKKGLDMRLVKVYIGNGTVTIDLGVQYKINYPQ